MASKKPKTVLYRRKREAKTDYKKRLTLLLSKKSRVVVRFTNARIIAQVVNFTPTGDKVIAGVDSFALKKLGWNYSCKNFPAAYLTGLLLGKKAAAAGAKEAVLDTGFKTPMKGGKQYAFLKGVLDGGLNVPHDDKIFPSEEKMSGKDIEAYASSAKGQQFAQYLKNKAQPDKMSTVFEDVKKKIMG